MSGSEASTTVVARGPAQVETRPVSREERSRFGLTSPVRTAAVAVSVIALTNVASNAVLRLLKLHSFWPSTMLDGAMVAFLSVPVLWWMVFLPLSRLVEKRHRAEERLRKRTLDLEALHEVTSATTATGYLDLEGLLSRVLDSVLRASGAEAGWIHVLGGDPAGASRFVVARGVAEGLVRSRVLEPRLSCAECRAWCLAPQASCDSTIAECLRPPGDDLRAAGFQQHRAILLPLEAKGGAILNLLWTVPRPCGEAETTLLRTVARQVGIFVDSANHFVAEQNARRQSDTLRSASLAITRSLDLEDVFLALLSHLGRLVAYDRAKVMLFESPTRLKVRAVSTGGGVDFPDSPVDSFEAGANATVSEVLASRTSICIADTLGRPGWGGRKQSDIERSWLGVPLLAGGEVVGLFTLVKAEPGFFTPERVHMVEALSAPASVAIANARLFREVSTEREQVRRVTRKLVDSQEAERRRVARELHDEAGQLLSSLMLGLRVLEREAASPDAVVSHARELKKVTESVQEGLHRLATDLRPAALDHVGLVPALGQLAAKFSGMGGPIVRLETLGFDGRRLPPEIDIALYRITQEALANALRHSGAHEVSLVLERRAKRLLLVIEDDGCGFDLEAAGRSNRLGLAGIRERAEMLGGTLIIESNPGSGTTLVVEIPSAD